jgi:hypothetical protein
LSDLAWHIRESSEKKQKHRLATNHQPPTNGFQQFF